MSMITAGMPALGIPASLPLNAPAFNPSAAALSMPMSIPGGLDPMLSMGLGIPQQPPPQAPQMETLLLMQMLMIQLLQEEKSTTEAPPPPPTPPPEARPTAEPAKPTPAPQNPSPTKPQKTQNPLFSNIVSQIVGSVKSGNKGQIANAIQGFINDPNNNISEDERAEIENQLNLFQNFDSVLTNALESLPDAEKDFLVQSVKQ